MMETDIHLNKDAEYISATKPDWRREEIIPGCYEPWKRLLRVIRRYQILKQNGGLLARVQLLLLVLRYRCLSVICGADIPLNTIIGGGLIIRHPNGIVIHPKTKIGPNCLKGVVT